MKNSPPLALSELLIGIKKQKKKNREILEQMTPGGVHPFLISQVTAGTKVFAIARRR